MDKQRFNKMLWRGKPDYQYRPGRGWFVAWSMVMALMTCFFTVAYGGSLIDRLAQPETAITYRWILLGVVVLICFIGFLLAIHRRHKTEQEQKLLLEQNDEEIERLERVYDEIYESLRAARARIAEEEARVHAQELDAYEDENDDIRAAMLARMVAEEAE